MKTTQSIRLDAKVIEHIKQIWKWNFNKWVELLYENYNTSVTHVWYSEFKNALLAFIEVAKKFKPEQPMSTQEKIHQEAVAIRIVERERLQAIADWATPEPIKSDYFSLFNSLSPVRKAQLNEIINATKKWSYREDSVEYTKNELLEKKWFKQFIWLV